MDLDLAHPDCSWLNNTVICYYDTVDSNVKQGKRKTDHLKWKRDEGLFGGFGLFGLSGLFGLFGLFGLSGLFSLFGLSSLFSLFGLSGWFGTEVFY